MSTPAHQIHSPDSLQILLQMARAIHTINQENIAFIQARKGQQVITKHEFKLQTKTPTNKKRKLHHDDHDDHDDMFRLINKSTTEDAADIIANWRYYGQSLIKEKIAVGNFINRKIFKFDDLIQLNAEYGVLLEKYSHLPDTMTESYAAIEGIMYNMEILQVAIGQVHGRVLDVIDPTEMNDAKSLVMDGLSKMMSSFRSKVSGAQLNLDWKHDIDDVWANANVVSFNDCKALTRKQVLSGHEKNIVALQPYVLNGRQYLASAGGDRTIKLWDLDDYRLTGTLTGHIDYVEALALYVNNRVPMLASGSDDKTIKLWDLSTYNNIQTLSGHVESISSLAVYERHDKTILISGSHDDTIKLWDLDSYDTITTLQGDQYSLITLVVYDHDDKSYLARSSYDSISIWDLDNCTLIKTLETETEGIYSLLIVQSDSKQILAIGYGTGTIELWSVGDYESIGTINADSDSIFSLDLLQCDGKVHLVSASWDGTIKIWDLESRSLVATLNGERKNYVMKVFMNGDQACLASGGINDHQAIDLWME